MIVLVAGFVGCELIVARVGLVAEGAVEGGELCMSGGGLRGGEGGGAFLWQVRGGP